MHETELEKILIKIICSAGCFLTGVLEKNMTDFEYIENIALNGKTLMEPAGAKTVLSPWSEILIMAAQLDRKPLERSVEVKTETVIGKKAKKPLVLAAPIVAAHMSFGVLDEEKKVAIAKGAKRAGLAVSSGEGGFYEPEYENAGKYIFEYVTGKYGINDENLQRVGAIDIKIGQSAKPGATGVLAGAKVTAEVAKMRNGKEGEDVVTPASFAEINSPEDLKKVVNELRERTGGAPIGVKIAANDVEKDLAWIKVAGPDYITLDGRGGGTGSGQRIWKENVGVPTIYALIRARKYMDENGMEQELVVTGGIRTSADIVKCLALGADVVALGTGVLAAFGASAGMGAGEIDGAEKVFNYFNVTIEEMKTMARASGFDGLKKFNTEVLRTVNEGIAKRSKILHVLD